MSFKCLPNDPVYPPAQQNTLFELSSHKSQKAFYHLGVCRIAILNF
jgi:hypothetical protein